MDTTVLSRMRESVSFSLAAVLMGGACLSGLAQSTAQKAPKHPPFAAESSASLSSLPPDALGPISAALGKDHSAYWVRPTANGLRVENQRQALLAEFTREGAELRSQNLYWGLKTRGYGYGDAVRRIKMVAPQGNANRVEYRRDGLVEWYENGPLGLEQGFTLADRPGKSSGQPLTLELALRGDLVAALAPSKKSVELRRKDGHAVLSYTGLQARDAAGRELRSWLELRRQRLLVRVDDAGARYPVVVDPWLQQAELTASDGVAGDFFGSSVAVSGTTAVIGTPARTLNSNSQVGVAYVFVQNGITWTQQAELIASDGGADDQFGFSVAVNGGTVVIGAPGHTVNSNQEQGAAYVFVQSGTTWSQQAELTSADGAAGDDFGYRVAISGSAAVAGAPYHTVGSNATQGAAYAFVQSGTTWTQQAELTASDGVATDVFGSSVAMDGSTLIVGAPATTTCNVVHCTPPPSPYNGSAYVFVQSGTTWSQQAELTASDGVANDQFGFSVSISGGTAAVGADLHGSGSGSQFSGAVYVFAQSGTTWTQQAELEPPAADVIFGTSVAVAGGTLAVGAPGTLIFRPSLFPGAAYVFAQNGSTWTEQQQLTVSDSASGNELGISVGTTGNIIIAGAPGHEVGSNQGQGSAYVFALPNFTLSANPSSLSVEQGTQGTSTIVIAPVNGFDGESVSFSASGLPSGVTATFTPNPATSDSTLTLSAGATATTGTATVTVTGTSGTLTQTTTLALTVTPALNFTLTATPNSLSLAGGSQGTSTITVTPVNGFSGSVLLAAILPTGVTAEFTPNPATTTSTLTLAVGETAMQGTQTVTVLGESGSLSQSANLMLTVTSSTAAAFSPTSLSFGNEPLNTTSAAKAVTLKNIGPATLYLGNIGITLGTNFAISANTCGATLAVNKTCKVSVTFTPTQLGAATDTLTFTDNAAGSPQAVSLSGTGEAQATLTPASYTFKETRVGSISAAYKFTLKNNLPTTVTGISYSTTGPFAVSSTTCATTLDKNASCTIDVRFSPTQTGGTTGTLSVTDSTNNSPQTASLSGTGD